LLFVIATVMAVLFLNKSSNAQSELAEVRKIQDQLVNSAQLRQAAIRQMRNNYSDATGSEQKTVIAQLTDQVSKLASDVTGQAFATFAEAQNEIGRGLAAVDPQTKHGLVQHMVELHNALGNKEAENAKLQSDKAQLNTQLGQAKKDLTDAQADFNTTLAQKDHQIAGLDAKFQKFEADHNQKLAEAKQDFLGQVQAIEKSSKAQANQITTLERLNRKLKKELAIYKTRRKGPSLKPEQVVFRPDGKVSQVVAEENLIYIDVGSKDRVTEGLRFTVYPYTGIPQSGAGKAIVEVTNLSANVSECRIITQDKDDPIIPGDLVANVVFNMLRTYTFVVEGAFDIDNTGDPSQAGNNAVKDLVRRYGGEITKAVTTDTDYVILGDSPARPRKPDDTDPQGAWDLYQKLLKDFNRYQDVKNQATSLQIPRLGGKRFLDLIGYIPARPAEEE
jgi:hypothetical protein